VYPGNRKFDAVVVGSGPNGFAAAIALQRAGLSVVILEAKASTGGGMRSAEITLPGFNHDICSAIHPMGVASPFFNSLPLEKFGLEWIYPTYNLAHPLDNGTCAVLERSVTKSAARLGRDEKVYIQLMEKLSGQCNDLIPDLLAPLRIPKKPLAFSYFGLQAKQSATGFANRNFKDAPAKALFAGLAAHSVLPLEDIFSNAIGLVLGMVGHYKGWPIPKGGSQQIANALETYFISLGGEVITDHPVNSLKDLPQAKAVLFDLPPRQILTILGSQLPFIYKKQLESFKHGPGVFKIDWALDGPVPFTAWECQKAGTVHLGGTLEEIAYSERLAWKGQHAEKPFVLFAQQSLFDATRARDNKHTAWAYCHVPNSSAFDMTNQIENQVERFAPGFKDLILARHVMNTHSLEKYNANYIGGDITGGASKWSQLFTRPVISLSPYSMPVKGMFICSSSTPPGGGVHGMCGFHAANKALWDVFKIRQKDKDLT